MNEINQVYVDSFNSRVYHLAQQKYNPLAGKFETKEMKAESEFLPRMHAVKAHRKTARFQRVPIESGKWDNRQLNTGAYRIPHYEDSYDAVQSIIDIQSNFTKAHAAEMARIECAVGLHALLGKASARSRANDSFTHTTSTVDFAQNQRIAALDSSGNFSSVNQRSLANAIALFHDRKQIQMGDRICGVATASVRLAMLQDERFINKDYVDTNAIRNATFTDVVWMGVHWTSLPDSSLIPSPASRLKTADLKFDNNGFFSSTGSKAPTVATVESIPLWIPRTLVIGWHKHPTTTVDRIPQYGQNVHQLLTEMKLGGVRIEESAVIELIHKKVTF